jgi:preprotein translocase subunit SecG
MVILITIIHVIVCLILVVVVLLQSGKAADLAGAFGGMGSQTVFGPRGSATVLSKATTISAVLFMLTSLTLSIMATRGGSGTPDLLKKTIPATGQKAPAPMPAPGQPGGIQVQGEMDGVKQGGAVTLPVSPAPQPQQK